MKKIKGKIGFCDNATLGIKDLNGNPLNGGHYVYIREINGNKCNVNVITSLEYANGNYNAKNYEKFATGRFMLYQNQMRIFLVGLQSIWTEILKMLIYPKLKILGLKR